MGNQETVPGYKITQINIVMDVLGGFSKGLRSSMKEILGGKRSRDVLRRMQKSVLSSSLNIARIFKVCARLRCSNTCCMKLMTR